MRRDLRDSQHLATVSFDGRFWDAYLELMDAPGPGQPARGRIAFSAADAGDAEPVRTTTIFIEDTAQDVVSRAREFKTHQLVALLRSAVPPDAEEQRDQEVSDETGAEGGPDPRPGPERPPTQGEPADGP